MKRGVFCLVLALLVLFSGPLLAPRFKPSTIDKEVAAASDIEAYLRARESQIADLKPDLAKVILWANPKAKLKTKLALVYLHGFSASSRDLSPVVERVAAELGANAFFTRLKAHGLNNGSAFKTVKAEDWINDAREALAIGRKVGDRVVLIGTSTGGLLALADVYESLSSLDISSLIMISPNFGIPDSRAKFISGPLGPWLARLLLGREHSFQTDSALQRQYWTTTYASEGIASLMDLVNSTSNFKLSLVKVPTLVLFTSKDTVVDVSLIRKKFSEIGSVDKVLIDLPEARRHEFAGDALGTQATDATVREIVSFVRKREAP